MALQHNANYGDRYLTDVALGGTGYLRDPNTSDIYELRGKEATKLDPTSGTYKFQALNPSEGAQGTLQEYLDYYYPGGNLKEGLRPLTQGEAAQSVTDYERKKTFGLLEDQINPPPEQKFAQGYSGKELKAMSVPGGTKRKALNAQKKQQQDQQSATDLAKANQMNQQTQQNQQQTQADGSIDVITDPVTGNSYSRDLSIPGSTYKPYAGSPANTPASTIAPPTQTTTTAQPQAPTPLEDIFAQYGYEVNQAAQQRFKLAPAASFKDVYNSIASSLDLANVAKQRDFFAKKIAYLDDELADKTADINENPWLSEGVRVSQIQRLQERYDLKRAPFAANLTTMENLYNDGREEARYVATQALQQYNTERQFQLDQIQEMQDQAEKQFEASLKLYELQNKAPDYGSGSIGEYQFAVSQGYKGSFSDYQNEDANRKISIARAGTGSGLTPYQENQTFIGLTNKYQADPIINAGLKGQTAVSIADQIIANPKAATSQLKALYTLVKNLDPDSAVREGELALASQTQSYYQTFDNSLARITEGRVISPDAAVALAQATKELAVAWNDTAARRQQQYQAQAQVGNVGGQFNQYLGAFQSGFGDSANAGGSANDPLGIR